MTKDYQTPRLRVFDPAAVKQDTRNKALHAAPQLHERTVAKQLGGRPRPASGALPGAKGDVEGVTVGDWTALVECKRTMGQSLSVKVDWLTKIFDEASGRVALLSIEFEKSVMVAAARKMSKRLRRQVRPAEERWVCMPESTFRALQERLTNGQSLVGPQKAGADDSHDDIDG